LRPSAGVCGGVDEAEEEGRVMMDLAGEVRARRFPELGAAPVNTHEIYGSAVHHCAICPIARYDRCTLTCATEREKIKDGVVVTVGG
jgi:hypothetical protein